MSVKVKVRAGQSLSMRGGVYAEGETFEVSAEEAKRLVADGVVDKVVEKSK